MKTCDELVKGYKIPALEDSIVEILAKGYSIGAFDGTKLYGILVLDEKVSITYIQLKFISSGL